jgi:hypothetical protein
MLRLIYHNRELLALVSLLGVSAVAGLLMHWIVICPCLYRRGSRFPTGLLFWRVFNEMRRYKEIKTAMGSQLTPYYFSFILAWFNLLLALGTALRVLWVQSHPPGY